MISNDQKRVKIQDVVENQLPSFVREDFPLVSEFLKQYYLSQEYQGAPTDLLSNIDLYLNLDVLSKNDISETTLTSNILPLDNTIFVSVDLIYSFPDKYGLIQIDDEIILYTSKGNNSFDGCIRGFSGVTSFTNKGELVFSESEASSHSAGTQVKNLSGLFLDKFLTKIKKQISPGFENRELYNNSDNGERVNQSLFLKHTKDFYNSKGTENSFEILFRSLYNENVSVIIPSNNLFRPSDAQYSVTKDIVVESIQGNPLDLLNRTLYQDSYPNYGISNAYGSVTNVEKITIDQKDYYRLSVDFDYSKDIILEGSVYGDFSVHPKTKVISQVSAASSSIDVDSTIGFPNSGNLVVSYGDGTTGIVTYTSKTYNQFLNIVGVSTLSSIEPEQEIRLNTFAYGYSGEDLITVRVGSVLSSLNLAENTYYYNDDDTAKIKSLGIEKSSPKTDCWIYNIQTKFDLQQVPTLVDQTDFTYRVSTHLTNNFRIGDNIVLRTNLSETYNSVVTDILNQTTFTISGQGIISTTNRFFTVERKLKKPSLNASLLSEYQNTLKYTTDIQNVYAKFNEDILVSSSSIPSTSELNFYDRILLLTGPYAQGTTVFNFPNHGYYTGDKVFYEVNPNSLSFISGLSSGSYIIQRIDRDRFKLATSLANIYASYRDTNENDRQSRFISVSSGSTNVGYFGKLIPLEFVNKSLEHQNILKEIKNPVNDGRVYPTEPGTTGILINGVEVLNYKSNDFIYHGKINSLQVVSEGENYDVINPPLINISDEVGSGATAKCSVSGSLQRIDLIDTGFDYTEIPTITISGGNGTGATAEVNTSLVTHSVNFYSDVASSYISTSTNTIGFSTYHRFRNYERVIYKTDGQIGVSGLTTDSYYHVGLVDAVTLKLFETESDAISGINTVGLSSFGQGIHRLVAFNKKRIVSGVTVTNSGINYENNEKIALPVGINTALDIINIQDHGYNSRDIVLYTTTGTSVSGLTPSSTYIVTKVDDDNFKLSQIGLGQTTRYFYYDTNQYVNLQSTGSGVHTFNYEPISVNIDGPIGVTTFSGSGQNFNAIAQPIFRGKVVSAQVTANGVGYGVTDIFNLDRQPVITLQSGSGARLLPIVSDGEIREVLIISPGVGYNCPPDLNIIGSGRNAKLTPVITNGQIERVVVNRPGTGYTNSTSIDIISAGSGAKLKANIQSWHVNLFAKKYNNILNDADDGILYPSNKFGIKYTYMYAPRKLRMSIYGKDFENNVRYGSFDLSLNESGEEIDSQYHSPIIGWAYDGNPIYGPFGFTRPSGGNVRLMKSGYTSASSITDPNRPPFEEEFFIEDFIFTNDGDLDEHNGRFCITPEFPQGTYAYFSTINIGSIENSGPFLNYKKPVFPYLIGNSFKSRPNEFNFNINNNQIDYRVDKNGWFRNTKPYNLNESKAYYNYLTQPNKLKDSTVNLKAYKGSLDSVKIVSGGSDYKVGDTIVFEPANRVAIARVEKILGKDVNNVSTSSTTFYNVEITRNNPGEYIAFTEVPHSFIDGDIVYISGLSTSTRGLQRNFVVGVSSEVYELTSGIGSDVVTGIVTYFNIRGNLNYPALRVDDILQIESEKVKVLSIDNLNSRVRVLRSQDGTLGVSHTATTTLTELTKKITFTSISENIPFNQNKKIYFNPEETLGIGTNSGVGIGVTLSFANPGAGITEIFIPTRSLYIPNHGLNTGERVVYSSNQGSSIAISTTGIGSTTLGNNSSLYVAKIDNNTIGLSTVKVGLGSTGTFVGIASTTSGLGLLYFIGVGTGVYHSLETTRDSVTSEVSKNSVTVSLAATHGLSSGDRFDLTVKPVTTFTVIVKYNDYNRRIVFNPETFSSGDVDVAKDTIYIQNHNYINGDKIIHSSSSPCGGLVNERIYYVIKYSADKIRLSETYIGATQTNKEFVDITSVSFGTISAINPKINGYKNSKIRFDTSDSSLSYTSGITYSAFKLNFYTDSSFTTIFETSKNSSTFEVNRVGNIGFSGSYVDLQISDFVPEELYYKFIPVNNAPVVKNQIVVDEEVLNHSKIVVRSSNYQGNHTVSGVGTTSFNFNLNYYPEKSSYNTQEASIEYKTVSRTSSGGIAEINVIDPGFGYDYLPGVSTIRSLNGSSAILESQSRNIGSISSYTIENIGFDYPSDNTLRPVCNLPEILKIEPLSSFEEIGISSAGRNYLTAPNLVVIDGFTNRVVRDVDLRYRLGDNRVTILTNTYGIYNTTPRIIPTNNTNGVGISSLQYNSSNQNVTVYLNSGFSDSFPFSVGDRVLIENVSVGVATTGYGYNSSNYEYSLFTLTGVYPGLGGNVGVVTYSLLGHLPTGRIPGNYDNVNSSGRIIAEKDFPIFRISLRKNNFIIGETVKSSLNEGIVESWNNDIDILKVSTRKDFSIGEVVVGQTSRTQGLVSKKYDFNADFSISASSIVKKGWESQAGFLNSNTERMSDNFYYQKFSYSLKSRVPLQTWDDPVSSLNHTAGYLKFSDLDIESDSTLLPIFGDRYNNLGSTEIIVDLYRENDLDCYSSYDYVTENSLNLNSRQASDEIYFRNSILTDYFESIGNRVLKIDDISGEFNSNERVARYSVVDRFSLESTYKKYFLLAQDTVFYDERQLSIVSLLQDGSLFYINQYGRVESQFDLGYYDATILGSEGNLRFYPTKYQSNNYNVTNVSFDINQVIGVGTTALGDVVKVSTSNTPVSVGTTTTIVSIADTYRSSKVLVQIKTSSNQYQVNEINLLHNGSDVYTLDYGQINSATSTTSSGLGTYNAYISGNNIVLDFIPSVSVASTASSIIVSIANTSSTGIGTQDLSSGTSNLSTLESNYVSISSSPTPSNNVIAEYSNENSGAYLIVSIEDTTNNNYEMLELIVVNDSTDTYLTQYGEVISGSGIGTFGSALVGNNVQIYFTPLPNIDVQVRSFELDLRISSTTGSSTEQEVIDLEIGQIKSNYGYYFGTLTDVRREFELTHGNREIFERLFNANSSEVVNITDDTITIPEHFFVTGEEVVYAWPGAGTTASIGIGTTTFAGIGQTDKLPSSVFVIKVDDTKIKLARSAEDALKGVPVSVDLLSVGVGTGHTITSINQNSKCLISIDNVIQSPIVSTATTTLLSSYLELSSFILEFDNVGSFFGNDLIKIDNEIMKIKTVGFGSTNRVLVDRPWMGTGISTHSSGSLITKIEGQYNIVDNTIHFVSAPYGNIPIGSTTNPPDERDWIGITTSSKFQGRVFLRSGQPNTSSETYSKNYIFDDISDQFDATTKDFNLKVNNQNITGISDNNAIILINSIFQSPSASLVVRQDYDLEESSGITSIRFTGTSSSVAYDPNNSSIPVGGIIVSVASTEGFGYQPLVAAGGTAIVSIAGTISSISIGNSGSGYRVGIQTVVNVGVYTSSTGIPNIEFIGTASVSNGNVVSVAITNPGTGYTSTNPPIVVFDSPLNYSNIPLVYSSSSSGVGTEATVDIVVGQGSSVIDFELRYTGYKYQVGDVLTFAVGGTSGIPTDTTKPFREFQITVDTTERDEFSGWHLGELQVFDSIESLFDGQRRVFPLSKDGNPISIRVSPGSNIDIQSTLLVFLNDILQVPGEGYTYQGGSVISFPEAPKGPSLESGDLTSSDRCTIVFYKGSGDIDVIFRDVLETVKVGDTLTINDDNFLCSNMIQQDERIVTEILSSDSVETNTYFGPGISGNPDCYRTVDWCKQKSDLVIDGNIISKSRIYYEPIVSPVSYLIQPVGVGSTIVYVDSIRPFFNQNNENSTLQNSITFISQDQPLGAAATATVSVAGTVSSINITNGGSGYISVPNVSVQVGFGTTQPATAVASITAGVVTSISVAIPGIGYTSSQPPVVLIEPPAVSVETNAVSQYFGDYGKVVGFGFTTSSGISTITFDLWIEDDSFVRDSTLVGTAITISGISTGDYILINDSNIGLSNTSITSLRNDSSSIGIGTQFVSNVYQVNGSTQIQKYIVGIGTTYVNRIEVKVSGMGTNTLDSFDSSTRNYIYSGGITTSTHFGSYSWGRIHLNSRTGLGSFGFYGNNGVSGIVTSTIVRRTNPLKYKGYL